MPSISIDTTSVQYQQLLAGLGVLRTVLAPRITLLRQLTREQQRAWLARDPLLRRTIRMATDLAELVYLELEE